MILIHLVILNSFSASELKMGMINIPVRYRDREYGSPQIDRFRDGLSF